MRPLPHAATGGPRTPNCDPVPNSHTQIRVLPARVAPGVRRAGPAAAHLHAGTVITPNRRVQLDLGHLRQDLSPGAPRCWPGKYPSSVKTREQHPTVDLGASQTREQLTALLVNKAINSCHLRNGANWVFGSPEAGWPSPARHTAWHSRSEAAAPPTTTPCRPVTLARLLSPDGEDFGWPRPSPSSPDLGQGTTRPDPPARPPRTRTPAATGS